MYQRQSLLHGGGCIRLVVWQDSGGTRTLTISAGAPSLTIHRLGGTAAANVPTRCLAQRTTTQTVSASPTTLDFNATDIYDPDGWHDPSGASTRLTVPTGKGGRLFSAWAQTETNTASATRIQFKVDGTTVVGLSPSRPRRRSRLGTRAWCT